MTFLSNVNIVASKTDVIWFVMSSYSQAFATFMHLFICQVLNRICCYRLQFCIFVDNPWVSFFSHMAAIFMRNQHLLKSSYTRFAIYLDFSMSLQYFEVFQYLGLYVGYYIEEKSIPSEKAMK